MITQVADKLLHAALKAGADEAECYYSRSEQVTIKVYGGEIESLTSAVANGVGLRVILGHRVGYAYTSDMRPDSLSDLVEETLETARFNNPDPAWRLAEPDGSEPLPGLCPEDFRTYSVADKVKLAFRLEELTGRQHPAVRRCREVLYADNHIQVGVRNSRGLNRSDERSVAYAVSTAIAESGHEMQTSAFFTAGRSPGQLNLERCAAEAVQRAVAQLNQRKVSSRTMPVVFENYAAALLLGVLAPMFTASQIQQNRSMLAGKLGATIASPLVTIIDDGRLPNGLASRSWDGEGVATRRKVLVEQGRMTGLLHNVFTAAKDGTESTGNADRGSYRSFPSVNHSNFYLAPGPHSAERVLADAGEALYVTGLHGLRAGNSITGEFSFGVTGFLFRNGELLHPVSGATVAGHFGDWLRNIQAVGDDLRFILTGGGMCGSPTISVSELQVSGA